MNLRHSMLAVITLTTVLSMTQVTLAGKGSCPECGKLCYAIPEERTQDKHFYEVECKDNWIPHFHWPWQQCCKSNCGRVITVNVLKKVEYECIHCGYHWDTNCADAGFGGVGQKGIVRNVEDVKSPPTPVNTGESLSTAGDTGARVKLSSRVSSNPSRRAPAKKTFLRRYVQ